MARAVLHAAVNLETASQVKEIAAQTGKSESAIVQEALNRYFSDLATLDQTAELDRKESLHRGAR